MPWKCNLFFNDPKGGGWSETYYSNTSSPAVIRTNLDSLAGARQQLLAGNVQLTNCRFSDDAVVRDGFLFPPTPVTSSFANFPQDYSFVSQDLRLYATLSNWRFLYIRGVPDILYNPEDAADDAKRTAWYNQLNVFIAALVAAGNEWAMKIYNRGAPKFLIDNFLELTGEVLQISTVDPHGLVPGDYAHFTGIASPSPRLGNQVVLSTPTGQVFNARQFYVRGVLPRKFDYTGKGNVQKYNAQYPQLTQGIVSTLNHRDTGRPFGQHRGRGSKRP